MITPHPTSKISPLLARGTLGEVVPATATKPGYIVLLVPNTSYQLHLQPTGPITAHIGKRLVGTINAQARRIDVVTTGGQYVEPLFGRPRRVQGTVIETTETAVVVDAGVPVHCTPTDRRQSPEQFKPGQLVSFDVLDGSSFAQDITAQPPSTPEPSNTPQYKYHVKEN
jgi:hypothetical protein